MFRSKDPPRVGSCSTPFWVEVASSLACSRPPPVPQARVATPPILTSRTATTIPFTPRPRTPDAAFTSVHGERTGTSTSGASFSGEV